jgi:DNA mismatch endonuclease, patch repair protein
MTDVLTKEQRSRCMAAIRSKGTRPEIVLGRLLRNAGYHYRANDKSLPGKPDAVFPRDKKVVFVHGCFWHRHNCKAGRSEPATRRAFWSLKFSSNKARDRRQTSELHTLGWGVLTVWQCQLKGARALPTLERIKAFLAAKKTRALLENNLAPVRAASQKRLR